MKRLFLRSDRPKKRAGDLGKQTMEQHHITTTPFISVEERAQLVRYCAAMSGKSEVAEDLAQETLLEAWRHEQALRYPSRRSQWLAGIARKVYLRWQRKQGREETHRYQGGITKQEQNETRAEQLFVDPYDIELDLERKELLELLERALALLPVETRIALIQHYMDDLPLAEVAQQLGTNTNALAVRLQRGKHALRRLLLQEMQQEFGVHCQLTESATWEVTPLWCYHCGKQRMLGKCVSSEGTLLLKCPVCSPGEYQLVSRNELPFLQGMKSYKPMLTQLRNWCHRHYRAALTAYFGGETIACEACKQPLIVLLARIEDYPDYLRTALRDWQWFDEGKLVSTFCPNCQHACNTTLSGLVLNLPETRAFAHAQSRITTLPVQPLETQGRSALLTRLESVTGNAVLNIISDEETYAVLRIEQEGF
jgi:RNA polymerase sigma-70 factor (ECF subfamily)